VQQLVFREFASFVNLSFSHFLLVNNQPQLTIVKHYLYPPSTIHILRLWVQGMLKKSIRELGVQTVSLRDGLA